MKITYSSPNRSHHYPYAQAMHRAGHLHAFVCGFSRLSPRAPLPELGGLLKRHDFNQTLFLASLKFKAPDFIREYFRHASFRRIDAVSYKWAKESDAFIYYRSQGLRTARKLHSENSKVVCVMEEVNSHVEFADEILRNEYQSLGLKGTFEKEPDYDLRLQTYEESDYILCPSEFVRRSFLTKGFSADKLLKVNFGFPAIETASQNTIESPDNTFRILYVGQLHYRKGLRYAIEAFKALNHPKKEFVIVGPKTSVTGLEKTKIPEGVVFTGPLKGEELKNQYRRASLFILPSLEEGLALVQGEALAFGVPLLITTNTGGDDIIEDGKEGFIVPPADINILTQRMQEMADDKFLLERMSESALQAAKSLGSWDKAATRLISQLSEAINPKRTSGHKEENVVITRDKKAFI